MMEFSKIFSLVLLTTAWIPLFIGPSSALQGFKKTCAEDKDCDTGVCNQKQKSCECLNYRDRLKNTNEKHFYDFNLNMCLGKVGQLCTLPSVTDQLTIFRCVPDAECTTQPNQPWSKEVFGTCSCRPLTQPSDDGKQCVSNIELRSSKAKVSSSDLVRPDGWSKSGSAVLIPFGFVVTCLASFMCSISNR